MERSIEKTEVEGVEMHEATAGPDVSHHRERCLLGRVEKLELGVLQRMGSQDKRYTYFMGCQGENEQGFNPSSSKKKCGILGKSLIPV